MKRLIFLSILLMPFISVSCDREQSRAVYDGRPGFSFASGVLNVEVSSSDEGMVMVPVFRGGTGINGAGISFEYDASDSNSSEPEWKPSDPDGLFSLTSKRAVFADNSFSSNVQIRFSSIDQLLPGRKYRMRLTIEDNVSPSGRSSVTVTVSRKLTFVKYGDAEYMDYCMFDNSYQVELFKAEEADIFRVMDPYSEGLVEEEYASEGLMQTPPEYVQFTCDADGHITFDPFLTGMLVPTGNGKNCMTWVYYPSEFVWGHDFSRFDAENRMISDKEFQLYGVYCLPDLMYGFLNEGAYKISILVK